MGNLIKMGTKIVPFPWRRLREEEGGGGGKRTPPWFSSDKFIHTQERKKMVTVLKYWLNIAKDAYLGSKQLSMPIIWSCHVTSEFLVDSL